MKVIQDQPGHYITLCLYRIKKQRVAQLQIVGVVPSTLCRLSFAFAFCFLFTSYCMPLPFVHVYIGPNIATYNLLNPPLTVVGSTYPP